jgi:hypothetical protein
MDIPSFDSNFVTQWGNRYHSCCNGREDDEKYQQLIGKTQKDVAEKRTISEESLKEILKWKGGYHDIQRYVKFGKYKTIYEPRFQLIISKSIAEYHYMRVLLLSAEKLYKELRVAAGTEAANILDSIRGEASGFRVPVASTVLHFIYPDRFPIIDLKTAEVLYLFDILDSTDRSKPSIYEQYHEIILEKATNTSCSIRAIDRALSAFHEQELQPEMNKKVKAMGCEYAISKEKRVDSIRLEDDRKFRQMIIDIIKAESRRPKP